MMRCREKRTPQNCTVCRRAENASKGLVKRTANCRDDGVFDKDLYIVPHMTSIPQTGEQGSGIHMYRGTYIHSGISSITSS